ncbi:MAG TPA: hypothetical protein PLC24_08630 [Myxococcota bacterium]|nr:hypothetical protein [Myxococcota bacterium]
MKRFNPSIHCLVILLAVMGGTGCGDGSGPTMDNGATDTAELDGNVIPDGQQPDLVVNPDAARDLAGHDLTGIDLEGADLNNPDLPFNQDNGPTDNGDGDTGVLPPCTDSAQCQLGNVCIDRQCVPGCNGDRDCPGNQHCKSDALPYGACLDCVTDDHCDDDMKCNAGKCMVTCEVNEECSATPITPFCDYDSGLCVKCLSDSNCPEGRLCIGRDCIVGCKGDRDCPDGLRCDPKFGTYGDCFTCVEDADCNGKVCRDHQCVIDCDAINCPAERPICDPATGNCLECMKKADCGTGKVCIGNLCITGCESDLDCGTRHCSNGSCVECTIDDHCSGGQKCRANTCSAGECFKDSDCNPGDYCHPLLYSCEDLPSNHCDSNSDCTSWIPGLLDQHCDPLTRECITACLSGFCLDLLGSGRDTCVNGGCYGCGTDFDCAGVRCSPYDRFCYACQDNDDCSVPGWKCAQDGACYECLSSFDCPSPKVCDTANGRRCVECLTSGDCKNPSKPVCGKSKTCIPACQNECESGDMICNPDDTTFPITALTCGDTDDDPCLEYGGYYNCGNGASCVTQGSGLGECVCNNECSSGQKWCASGKTDVVETCKQDSTSGCWYISTSYCSSSYGEICSNGTCVCDNKCTENQTVCTSTTAYKKCVSDYYTGCLYWTSYTCSSGYYCSNGKCQ